MVVVKVLHPKKSLSLPILLSAMHTCPHHPVAVRAKFTAKQGGEKQERLLARGHFKPAKLAVN